MVFRRIELVELYAVDLYSKLCQFTCEIFHFEQNSDCREDNRAMEEGERYMNPTIID